MKPWTKQDLIKTLNHLSELIEGCGHAKWCESNEPLGVYCTCNKEKAEDLCRSLIDSIEKAGLEE